MDKMTHAKIEEYVLSMPGAVREYPFGEGVAVYKVHDPKSATGVTKMFALIAEGKNPVQISLKCDPGLSELLRGKYETVMPGDHLNKKHWNTILLTGQLDWGEVSGLIVHSYSLVCSADAATPIFSKK